jgi:hypothetical protein
MATPASECFLIGAGHADTRRMERGEIELRVVVAGLRLLQIPIGHMSRLEAGLAAAPSTRGINGEKRDQIPR